tara:strand:+ start:135 stop:503 length:369 start_codon:yes stop_codon:yes gene_type:complete
MYPFVTDLILILHFSIVIFITSLFFLIPVGYKLNWSSVRKKNLRKIHVALMAFITLETLLGIACPLTYLENYLLNKVETELFLSFWLKKIIYWDFPSIFFIILYLICFAWTIIMWILFPPKN